MFQTKIVEKIKHTLGSITSSPKLVLIMKKVGKYDTARQATDENIIRRTKDTRMNTIILCLLDRASS